MRLALLCLIFSGCNHDALPGFTVDGGADLRRSISCSLDKPLCAHGCGSDWIAEPTCSDGSWRCPPDTVDARTCPTGTCWGPPAAGERCGPSGWECKPDESDYALCPIYMCPECEGFVGPVDVLGCHCKCMGTNVICSR